MTVAIISEGAIIVNVVILATIPIAIIIAMDIIIAVAATVVATRPLRLPRLRGHRPPLRPL